MPLKSAEEYIAVLERSNLLAPAELAYARDVAREVPDATQLAKTLAREEILTFWQAGQMLAGRSTFFLGKYKLISLLGRGGMGSVFLAEHVVMHRRVALKIIPRSIAKNPAALDHFLAEARTIAALDHPNIVRAYSVDNDEGDRYYLVMEFVDGLDLQRVVEVNGPLDCESAVDCILQAADGLAHAHSRNMIHCDIKPSNLILNEQGAVKILDMGLARLVGRENANGSESSDPNKHILGSVDYLAPEQALGTSDFDHRADLYALGCTMYYLLTGHPPFPEGTLAQKIVKHQTLEPSAIGIERPEVPDQLIAICNKMMAKDPANRYQSAAELADALENWKPEVPQPAKKPIAIKTIQIQPLDSLGESSPWELEFGDEIKAAAASGVHDFGFPPGSSGKMPVVKSGSSSSKLKKTLAGTRERLILTSCLAAVLLVFLLAGIILPFVYLGDSNGTNGKDILPPDDRTSKNAPTNVPVAAPAPVTPAENAKEAIPDNATPPNPAAADNTNNGNANAATPDSTAQPASQPTAPDPVTSSETNSQPDNPPPPEPTPPVESTIPKVDPLKQVLPAVDLPEHSKNQSGVDSPPAFSLGQVVLEGETKLKIELIGGEQTGKGNFSMQEDAAEGAAPSWNIVRGEHRKSGKPNNIAKLHLKERDLAFEWSSAVTPGNANALRNCALLLAAGDAKCTVQFRSPKIADPLMLDFENGNGIVKMQLPLENPPDLGKIHFEIVELKEWWPDLKDELPSYQIQSEVAGTPATKKIIRIDFNDPNSMNWTIVTTLDLGKKSILELESAVYVGYVPKKPFRLSLGAGAIGKQKTELDNKQKSPPKNAAAKNEWNQSLEELAKSLKQMNDVQNLLTKLDGRTLGYRIYVEYDKGQVALFQMPPQTPQEVE